MIIDGKFAAKSLFEELKPSLELLKEKSLNVVQVGENPASTVYVNLKRKKAEELGITFNHIKLSAEITVENLRKKLFELDSNPEVGGIILQLPLPEHLEPKYFLDLIAPEKDVDCLTSVNLGRFFTGTLPIMPGTPYGVIKLLEFYKIDVAGKNIVVVGRSNLVGKPLAIGLVNRDATVTLCHSKTENLKAVTQNADIVILAVGKAKFFGTPYFKQNQTVIDVGLSKGEDGKLYGDVDFENVKDIVENISPVPGGVGPMTIYGIFENFVMLNN